MFLFRLLSSDHMIDWMRDESDVTSEFKCKFYEYLSDIEKSTGPPSVTEKNSGGPMKTLIAVVRLSTH